MLTPTTAPVPTTIKDLPPDDSTALPIKAIFNGKTPMAARQSTLANFQPGLAYIDTEGKFVTCVGPTTVFTAKGIPVGPMVSHGDSVTDSSPIKLEMKKLGMVFVTVGNNELAKTWNVPLLDDTQYAPSSARNSEDLPLPATLDFGVTNPTWILLPNYCPLAPGSQMPHGLDLNNSLADTVLANLHPHKRLWLVAKRLNLRYTNGQCLYLANTTI